MADVRDRPTSRAAAFSIFDGGGEMAAIMRDHDWSTSAVGPPENWPQSLRSAVGMMLANRHLMFVAWGPELSFLYNDGYVPVFGKKHPSALGRPFREVWSEIWDDIAPLVDTALRGQATWSENLPLLMERNGYPEETWFTFSYSPVRDETGRIAGLFCAGAETTHQVLSERRTTAERERQRQMLRQMPGFVGMLSGPELIYTYVNDAYVAISERTDFIGRPFREVFADIAGQGYHELFERVFRTGEGVVTRGMELRLHGREEPQYVDFVLEPIRDDDGAVTGVFVGGYDVTEQRRAQALIAAERDRAQSVLANVTEGFVLLDRAFRTLEINAEGLRMENRPAEAILGRTQWEAYPGTEHTDVGRCYKKAMAERVPVTLEHQYRWADGREAWFDMRAYPVPEGLAIFYRDITERKRADLHQKLLIDELNHRVKNTLATIQSIAVQTFRTEPGAAPLSEQKATFESRLIALAKVHDVLTRESWEGANLTDVVHDAIAAHFGADDAAFTIDGPDWRLPPKMALSLSMALHELCTNAAKYGALSVPEGRVSIVWTVEPAETGSRLELQWAEEGGPPVSPPTRKGFGSRLIERQLGRELRGTVRLDYATTGVVCNLDLPLEEFAPGGAGMSAGTAGLL